MILIFSLLLTLSLLLIVTLKKLYNVFQVLGSIPAIGLIFCVVGLILIGFELILN